MSCLEGIYAGISASIREIGYNCSYIHPLDCVCLCVLCEKIAQIWLRERDRLVMGGSGHDDLWWVREGGESWVGGVEEGRENVRIKYN